MAKGGKEKRTGRTGGICWVWMRRVGNKGEEAGTGYDLVRCFCIIGCFGRAKPHEH